MIDKQTLCHGKFKFKKKLIYGGYSLMVERQFVELKVVGSSPTTHPYGCQFFEKI